MSSLRQFPAWDVLIGHPDCQPWVEQYRASSADADADAAFVRAQRRHIKLLADGGAVGPATASTAGHR